MKKILIAEDEYISQKKLRGILEKVGHCDLVADGVSAIEAFKAQLCQGEPYDLVTLDIQMPNLNGHVVAQEIRSLEEEVNLGKNALVLVISQMDNVDDITTAFFEDGVDGFIGKPFSSEKIYHELAARGIM